MLDRIEELMHSASGIIVAVGVAIGSWIVWLLGVIPTDINKLSGLLGSILAAVTLWQTYKNSEYRKRERRLEERERRVSERERHATAAEAELRLLLRPRSK